jgi:hypothetical protein
MAMAGKAPAGKARKPNEIAALTKEDVQKIVNTVRALAPEFRTVKTAVIEQYIEIFYPLVGRKVFGDKYFLAMALLICHKMKLAGLGDNKYGTIAESMRLASVSEGDSSISFNATQSPTKDADAEYLLTSYGVQFNDIKRRVIIPIHCGGAS